MKRALKRALINAVLLSIGYGGTSTSVTADPCLKFSLGYEPTINKKIAKRLKRKAARRRNAPAGAAKPHNQRNKKGRP